jgi:hypothetical protein
MLTDYKLGKYQADLRAETDRLGMVVQLGTAGLKSVTDLIVSSNRTGSDLIKFIFGGAL